MKDEGFAKEIDKAMSGAGKFAKVAGAAFAAVAAAAAAGASVAAKAGIEWESAFAGVKKTVDATDEVLARISEGLRAMAKEMPMAATELAGIAESAGQLGIKTDSILGFTKVMADLGVATNLAGEEAASTLAKFANITQMDQSNFDRLGSTIVALGNNLATTEAVIAAMGMRLAGTGAQTGLTEAQILSFAGALSSMGVEAEAGGRRFQRLWLTCNLRLKPEVRELMNLLRLPVCPPTNSQMLLRKMPPQLLLHLSAD